MSYARVHENLLLPTIEELVGLADEADAIEDYDDRETRVQMTASASVRRIPSAAAIVRAAVRPSNPIPAIPAIPALPVGEVVYEPHPTPIPPPPPRRLVPPPFPRAAVQTVLTRRTMHAMRWPVFLCGFVAGIFGGVALLKSPVGHRPGVQHVMNSVRAAIR